MTPSITTFATNEEFVQKSVEWLTKGMQVAIEERGRCILGLSGGSTPRPIYEALGKAVLPWEKIWIFLVDDRYIRADDPKSNQFLLRSTLLKTAPIPESNLLLPDTSLPLPECITLYERHLTDLLRDHPADIATFGLGDDGHTASLFPPLSRNAFGPTKVIATVTDHFDVRDRISTTLPVLTAARQKIFFLSGEKKLQTWQEMIESNEDAKRWPAKEIVKSGGVTVMYKK